MISLRENYKTQMDKFIKSGVDKQTVNDYFRKFRTINTARYAIAKNDDIPDVTVQKGSDRFDVDKYKTFDELKSFVDYVAGKQDVEKLSSQQSGVKSEAEKYKIQADKFIKGGISKKTVEDYLKKFKIIKDNKYKIAVTSDIHNVTVPKDESRFDILSYKSFEELEAFADYVLGQVENEKNAGKKIDAIEIDAKPLIEKNGLKIYYATDRNACVKYKGGGPYSWCVSRDDSSNMYNTYRYKPHQPAFYFVKDIKATEEEFSKPFSGQFENPWHFIVIQVTAYGDYIVTDSNNTGDEEMSWSDIVRRQPKLTGMEEYFKSVPLTDREKQLYQKFNDGISDDEFKKLSYEDKSYYLDIAIPKIELTNNNFFDLPDDLKNKYISFGLELTDEQYKYVKTKSPLFDRFVEMSSRVFERRVNNRYNDDIGSNQLDSLLNSVNGQKIIKEFSKTKDLSFLLMRGEFKTLLDLLGKEYLKKTIDLSPEYSKRPEKLFFYNDESTWQSIEEFLGPEYMKNKASVHIAIPNSNYGLYKDRGVSLLKLLIEKYGKTVDPYDVTYVMSPEILNYALDIYRTKIMFETGKQVEHFVQSILSQPNFAEYVWKFIKTVGLKTISEISKSYYPVFFDIYNTARQSDAIKADRLFLNLSKQLITNNPFLLFGFLEKFKFTVKNVVDSFGGPDEFKNKVKLTGRDTVQLLNSADGPEDFEYLVTLVEPNKLNTDLDDYQLSQFIKNNIDNVEVLFKHFGYPIVTKIGDYRFFALVDSIKKENGRDPLVIRNTETNIQKFINTYLKYWKDYTNNQKISSGYMTSAILMHGSINKLNEYAQQIDPSSFESIQMYDLVAILKRAQNDEQFNFLFQMMSKSFVKKLQNNTTELTEYIRTRTDENDIFRIIKAVSPFELNPHVIGNLIKIPYPIKDPDRTNYVKKVIAIIGEERVKKALLNDDAYYLVNFITGWMESDVYTPIAIELFGLDYMKNLALRYGVKHNKFLTERHQEYKQFFK